MERLTTDTPNGNFETMLNFVYGKDGWAHIRHDGEHEDVTLTDWVKQQCLFRGCDGVLMETPEDIDQRLCDCMDDTPICPVAMAYCFGSQAVHMRSRLAAYEDTMPLERAQELSQAEKDGRLVVLPCKVGDTVYRTVMRKDGNGHVASAIVSGLHMGDTERNRRYKKGTEYIVLRVDGNFCAHIDVKQIGKTVFLTREEAEAVLKKREEADNETD